LLNGYYYDFNEDGTRRYLFGTVLPDGHAVPAEFTLLAIPIQTYAIFDSSERHQRMRNWAWKFKTSGNVYTQNGFHRRASSRSRDHAWKSITGPTTPELNRFVRYGVQLEER
jgi:hypothetical protein